MTAELEPQTAADERFMAAALALGRRGLGRVAPNPAVGALLVKDGVVVGRGWTQAGGRPHAETEALRDAGAAARGATLYVTLEPCAHHGRTPPCAAALVDAGVGRVVFAIEDPDPRVAGAGMHMLKEAGIPVTRGIGAAAARRANLGHVLRVTQGRPLVTLKLAETADGFAAGARHDARLAITGALANAHVHMMRAMHDAIMVGSGTLATDDPLMTVRLPGLEGRKPLRVVLDSNLSLSRDSRLVATAREVPALVIAGAGAPAQKAEALGAMGVEVVTVARDAAGHVDLAAALGHLASRGVTRIFSEGGPRVGAELIAAGFADDVLMLTATKPFGREGVPALSPTARQRLADEAFYKRVETRLLGADRLARFEKCC